MQRTVIGLFSDRTRATAALARLLEAGFTPAQVGVVAPHAPPGDGDDTPMATGAELFGGDIALGGGMLGATTGAVLAAGGMFIIPGIGPILVAGLLASLIGGATGWLAGGLVALGIAPDAAHESEEQVHAGGTLIVVRPHGRDQEARALLAEMGAQRVRGFGHDQGQPDPVAP